MQGITGMAIIAPTQSPTETHSMSNEQMRTMMAKGIPFVANSGLEVEVMEKGYVKCRMPFAPNKNHVGTMYAGALFTLAELPGGVMFITSFDSKRFYPIVRDMSIRFRRPAVTDVTVEVRVSDEFVQKVQAEAEANGKADYEWECELKDDNGVVVAIAKNIYQLRKLGT
jgi:acyl-coenzyme A thioesterase PaaI-like protein